MGFTPLPRRNTAARLPQLCALQCLTSLTLFGKSAAAATHGHRLAGHLAAVAGLKQVCGVCGGVLGGEGCRHAQAPAGGAPGRVAGLKQVCAHGVVWLRFACACGGVWRG